jgi:hypothetical protein
MVKFIYKKAYSKPLSFSKLVSLSFTGKFFKNHLMPQPFIHLITIYWTNIILKKDENEWV